MEDISKIKLGTILVVKDSSDIDCDQWNEDEMEEYCGEEFTVNEKILSRIKYDPSDYIFTFEGWYFYLDMLEIKNDNVEKKSNVKNNNHLSLKREIDQNILNEMISLVDRERFKKLIIIGSGLSEEDIVENKYDNYLKEWAESKYNFFLLFGKKLSIEKDIEANMTEEDMDALLNNELYPNFPKYISILKGFQIREYIDNKIYGYNYNYQKYFKENYIVGSKVTKFLSSICKDKSLNDFLATKIIGKSKVKAKVCISIDPYDFLTMSLNNNGWESCQKLGEGEYGTGSLSLMLDDSTMMAFKYNGYDSDYSDYGALSFSGNSKSWRQCIYSDLDTASFIFSREYPEYNDLISKFARDLLEKTVSEYLSIQNIWRLRSDGNCNYRRGSSLLYHDVKNDFNYSLIIHKTNEKLPNFRVGKDFQCPCCDSIIDEPQQYFACSVEDDC